MRKDFDTLSVTILHISDTQFGQYHRFDRDSLASHLLRDLRALNVPPIDLVILSGDITERALPAEFADARRFLDSIMRQTCLGEDKVVVVPGNHDVSWALSRSYFDECAAYGTQPREPYAKKWDTYKTFINGLYGPTGFTDERPYRLHRFDDLQVVVAGLNSTMRETHQDDCHYGWCGTDQLQWFAGELARADGMLRIGVLHHNARRRAAVDNENLRDMDDLDHVLSGHLDLLLHGHTHEGKEDRLPDGTVVLATGSTAVSVDWRPDDVPNQYQVLHVTPSEVTRWARQWEGRRWIADPRVDRAGASGTVTIAIATPGWLADDSSRRELPYRLERGSDLAAEVEQVTKRDLGPDCVTEVKSLGDPPLRYVLATRPAAPMRCVGVAERMLDDATVADFDERLFSQLRGLVDQVIVHPGPDVPALRERALRDFGIRVRTWIEYNALLDTSAYRTWLSAQLNTDEQYPQNLYQPQRYQKVNRYGRHDGEIQQDVFQQIYPALLDDQPYFALVLGDAGYGKSFLVRRLAYELLTHDRTIVTPIVVYLRDREKGYAIDEMVSDVLIPSKAAFQVDRFRHSLETGCLALLVDGYDEFAVRVGYANAAAQLQTFIDAMQGRAKLVLTTRPNHFLSTDQATSKLFDNLGNVHQGRAYLLEPFNETQQRGFLTSWFTAKGDPKPEAAASNWMAALSRVDNLPELATTPRMLSFMVQDLKLESIREAAGRGVETAASLYERLVERWLSGEAAKIDPKGRSTISAKQRRQVMEELALLLWQQGERDVGQDVLQQVARQVLNLPQLELNLDQAAQVIGGRTLLHGTDRRWRFAHQSIWEFLLASRLAALLRAEEADQMMGQARLTELTFRFLRDLAPNETLAWASRQAGGRHE